MSDTKTKSGPPTFGQRVRTIYESIMKANASTNVRDTVAGVDPVSSSGFFSPGQPIKPMGPNGEQGRALDYASGYNIQLLPRGYETASFPELRMLAEFHDVTRLLIETRKDQIESLDWTIKPRFGVKDKDALNRAGMTEEFMQYPDGETSFHTWVRELIEDILVIDAPTIYADKTDPLTYKFKIVDGTTIKLIIDEEGRRPAPPSPAYQQIIKGMPAWNYSTDTMIYMPRNPRPGRVYGMSPVQQIIITVNIALRRQSSQLQYFTEGNIPDAFIGTPESWTPEQIVAYQKAWDSIMEGQTAQRRHAKFVPGGVDIHQTQEVVLKNEFDEWLTKICCFAFSIPPTAFIQQTNRSVADNVKEAAEEEGLAPLTRHVKRIMDCIIQKHLGQYDLEFAWSDREETDPQLMAVISDTKLRNGTLTINEARAIDGKDPVEGGDVPVIMTASGPIPVASLAKLPTDPMQGFLAPQNGAGGEGGAEGGGGSGFPPKKKPPASEDTGGQDAKQQSKDVGQEANAKKKEAPAGKAAIPFSVKAATLKSLYVYRPLLNAGAVIEHFKKQGFKTCLAPDDMHVTQMYSKARVNWDLLQPKPNKLTVGTSRRSMELLGANGEAVVLRFESFQLRNRWQQFMDMGCSWDWESYKPHITITYEKGDVDFANVEPYKGDLIFGPEVFEEVEEDWADNIVEEAQKPTIKKDWNEADHPRVPAGSPEGGEFTDGGDGGDSSSSSGSDSVSADPFDAHRSHEFAAMNKFVDDEAVTASFFASAASKTQKRSVPSLYWIDPLARPAGSKTESRMARLLASILSELADKVWDQLKDVSVDKVQKVDPPELADIYSQLRDKYLDSIDSLDLSFLDDEVNSDQTVNTLADLIADTGKQTLTRIGVTDRSELINQLNVNARDFAQQQAAELVGMRIVDGEIIPNPNPQWSISESTRDMLRSTITEAFDEGIALPDLADAIKESTAFSESRAMMIARTESLRAANRGTLAALKTADDNGLTVKKTWLAAPDSCDICLDNQDDGPIDMDEDFTSGDDAPPAHPNCRCALSADVSD